MYNHGVTGTSINEFRDVTITGVLDDQILQYNTATGQWENVTASLGGSITGALNDLSDVTITSPSEFQVLEYNGTSWVNTHASVATYVRNADSVTLGTGTAVYLFGATGDHATVKRADNDSDATSSKVVGLVAAPIAQNNNGVVITRGYVDGIDLSVGYTAGDILWLGEDGGFTKVKPTAPEHTVFLGVVVRATNNGIVYVATQNGYELDELHDVDLTSPVLGNVLEHNGTVWVNRAARPPVLNLQTAVNGRKYGAANTVLAAVPAINTGSCALIVFSNACTITDLSIYLNATYSGATTYTYRLGIYSDSNGAPGSLLFDAGTLSIATGATAGFKTITLGTPQSIAANTPVWLVCAATHSGTVPTLINYAGNMQPYLNYGLSSATHYQASCLGYTTAPGTAFPSTWSMTSPETQPVGVAVWATVTVP